MELRCLKIFLFTLSLHLSCLPASAQDVSVRSGFFKDSLRVGDETGFFLAADYPRNLNILFPDSTYDFTPFEYRKKRYFPTRSRGGRSYDSVVYYLSTFEIERVQTLNLPVYQLHQMDCTAYRSNTDTVLLTSLLTDLPDTLSAQNLPLKVNIAYQNVLFLFNYPILLIVLAILLVTVLVVWFVFGKKIRKYFQMKRMQKAHQKFIDAYTRYVENIRVAFSSITTENALSHWKKYMEQLEARPYTKLTTHETLQIEKDDNLGRNLHALDGAIYGHNTSVIESLEQLKAFADQRFAQKLEEVKHG